MRCRFLWDRPGKRARTCSHVRRREGIAFVARCRPVVPEGTHRLELFGREVAEEELSDVCSVLACRPNEVIPPRFGYHGVGRSAIFFCVGSCCQACALQSVDEAAGAAMG